MENEQISVDAVELATELTIAWLSNPNTRAQASEVPDFLRVMHDAVKALNGPSSATERSGDSVDAQPAVSVRKSLASPDQIISLIDGKPYKSLKRHLSRHGITPQEYRAKYGLKPDYPMVAPSYAEKRRALAKSIGLGRKRASQSEAPKAAAAPKRRARQAKVPGQPQR